MAGLCWSERVAWIWRSMPNVFSVDSLYFSYGNHEVLSGIFLEAHESEIVGIVGRNGCGKSTLFSALTLVKAPTGSLFYNDEFIEPSKRSHNIGYLPQCNFLPKEKRVLSIINMFGFKKAIKEDILRDDRIFALRHEKFGNLSGGEKRYIEFMLVISCDQKIVILDEPFTEVEPIYESRMIEKIRQRNKIYIISDHRFASLAKVCSRFYLLIDGVLMRIKNEDELRSLGYLH